MREGERERKRSNEGGMEKKKERSNEGGRERRKRSNEGGRVKERSNEGGREKEREVMMQRKIEEMRERIIKKEKEGEGRFVRGGKRKEKRIGRERK